MEKDYYIESLDKLKKYLPLENFEELKKVEKIHPFKITKYYLSLINLNDKNDPIRKLIIPSVEELDTLGDYDTSGENESTKFVGLQHKYNQTALILSTNRCEAYCRFCFRKRLVGLANSEILKRFDDAVNYIKNNPEITNVLITGGDPFSLPTEMIETFLSGLDNIKHLKFVRFGTRVPVVNPNRIIEDKKLLEILKKYSKKTRRLYVVTHFSHPREITEKSIEGIDALLKSGIIIQNQTVLLKGVNDNSKVLEELMNKLTAIGVNPYYVFQCRPVKRVKRHFSIPIVKGLKIIEEAKRNLNGIAKRFRYVMSHKTGKIEIIGIENDKIYFKQHQAKNENDLGKLFSRKINLTGAWLDEFEL